MKSFIAILWQVILSNQFIQLPSATEYLAQFTLPDNNQAQLRPLGNIISKLQSSFQTGSYQIITRKCSYSKFNQFFRISDSGNLFLSRDLDRDDIDNVCGPLACCDKDKCVITLDLIVTLRRSNQKLPVRVLIDIVDENDNSPTFMESTFPIAILENEAVNNRYNLPSAFDLDSPKYQIGTYTLSGRGMDSFTLSISNGLPFLIAKRSFDFEDESQRSFNISLVAKDYGAKIGYLSLYIIVVDVNDNAPTCVDRNANISIAENTTYIDSIFTFNATDLDSGNNGKISYKFSTTTIPSIKDIFRIDSDTGRLYLLKKLDYELYSEQNYKVTIQASDNGVPPLRDFCSIEIRVTDLNDNSPVIEIEQIQPIPENTQVREPVLKFYVRDDDTTDNDVTCYTTEMSPGLKLIQVEKFSYLIYASGMYDREVDNNLTLWLICQDSGKIPKRTKQLLVIPIKDKNDNTPRFPKSKYETFILEDFPLNKSLINVRASDDDSDEFGKISYEIGLESQTYFAINKDTGDLTLVKPLDREVNDVFNISVTAVDGGSLKGYTRIEVRVLDVNDNPPQLVHGMHMNITENVVHGSVVGYFVVRDQDQSDNGNVEWKHELIGNSTFLLEVDNVTILTVGDIDRELVDSLYVVITMTDKGTPQLTSTATITISVIDLNDNIPVVTYPTPGAIIEATESMTIPTNAPKNTKILTIKSYDPDIGINGKVMYNMLPANGSKYFTINQTDGRLLTHWSYDTISFTPTHPNEGLYEISFSISNQVKSSKNGIITLTTSFFFVRIVPYRHFINNEIFQQHHRRPFLNNIVLLILIGGFTISLSTALIAAIVWAKSKYSSESNNLEQVQNNDGKFMMMMMTGEQVNSNNTYVYDPYCSWMTDRDRMTDNGYSLNHSRSSTFNARRTGREHSLLNNYESKTMPRIIVQQDAGRYCGSDVFNPSNSLSTNDLAGSTSTTGRQPKLTNSFYRHFEHNTDCNSPLLQSLTRRQSLEHPYGSISPRAASICDPTPNIATTSNWVPRIPTAGDDSSNSFKNCC